MKLSISLALCAMAGAAQVAMGYEIQHATALNCRTEPSTKGDVANVYQAGDDVVLECQTSGETINGNALWGKTTEGCYVADYYLKTGSNGYVTKRCDEAGAEPAPEPSAPPAAGEEPSAPPAAGEEPATTAEAGDGDDADTAAEPSADISDDQQEDPATDDQTTTAAADDGDSDYETADSSSAPSSHNPKCRHRGDDYSTAAPGGDSDESTPAGDDGEETTPAGEAYETTPAAGGDDEEESTPAGGDDEEESTPAGDDDDEESTPADEDYATTTAGDDEETTPAGEESTPAEEDSPSSSSAGDSDDSDDSDGGSTVPGPVTDDYPYAGDCDGVDPWLYYKCQCTSFAAWRINKRLGVDFHNKYKGPNWGNANTWDDAARESSVAINSKPVAGCIAQTDAGNYGHVAWVTKVTSTSVTVEEYNYNSPLKYGTRTVPKSAFQYIHIKV
ncbi:hypothetical protein IWW48_003606 [Coemansia sp. RSA 1200]|nr:hypothetical protein IWW48_003606 [Coemansia sp. RSA 1200]